MDSCETAHVALATGADVAPSPQRSTMNRKKLHSYLVIQAIDLLRQARSGLNSESSRSLEVSLDKAIGKLHRYLRESPDDPDQVVVAVLKILGRGLAALPALQRLIEMMTRK